MRKVDIHYYHHYCYFGWKFDRINGSEGSIFEVRTSSVRIWSGASIWERGKPCEDGNSALRGTLMAKGVGLQYRVLWGARSVEQTIGRAVVYYPPRTLSFVIGLYVPTSHPGGPCTTRCSSSSPSRRSSVCNFVANEYWMIRCNSTN